MVVFKPKLFLNVPRYIWASALATATYLTVEIPFSRELVSLLGSPSSQNQIDAVEIFGRVLFGIAVALAVITVRTLPALSVITVRTLPALSRTGQSFRSSIVPVLWRASFIVGVIYAGLYVYGEARGLFSTGAMRKDAFISNLAVRTMAEDGIGGRKASADPLWLALMSGMPALFDADRLVAMSGKTVSELVAREAKRSLSDTARARSTFFPKATPLIDDAYATYQLASKNHASLLRDKDNVANFKWKDFRNQLSAQVGRGTPRIGSPAYEQVMQEVRKDGLPLSYGFDLDDEQGFKNAVKRQVISTAEIEFRKGVVAQLGEGTRLKPDATREAFIADAGVQAKLRDSLREYGISGGAVISPSMSDTDFMRTVYPGLYAKTSSELSEMSKEDPRLFASYRQSEGRDAMMGATLPSTALLLSLAGALFHIYKLAGYLVVILGGLSRIRPLTSLPAKHALAAAALIAVVALIRPVGTADTDRLIHGVSANPYSMLVAQAVVIQPGLFVIADKLAENGPWRLIGMALPKPTFVGGPLVAKAAPAPAVSDEETGSVTVEQTAMLIPVPTPAPR